MARLRAPRIANLPKPILCVPLVLHWFWLAARYRSLTLPSTVNPAIETGGLAGESKSACLAQIAPAFRANVAAWTRIAPGDDPVAATQALGIGYPLIAKPDIGWCGYGVRSIADAAGLRAYAAAFPRDAAFIIQHLVSAPMEAGLFYIRRPGAGSGRLTAMAFRHAPELAGDGRRSVAELIASDRSSSKLARSMDPARLAQVPGIGERVVLTTVASLRVGAIYRDMSAHITPPLEACVDAIARSMPDFHFGRFDVRFESLAALQRGAFSIIEVNGAGSEAIGCWDPSWPLRTAFAGVFAKQRLAFELGAVMRAAGHVPVGVVGLAGAWLRQQRLIRRYPPSN